MINDNLPYFDRQVLRQIQILINGGERSQAWPLLREWDTWSVVQRGLARLCPLVHEQSYSRIFDSIEYDGPSRSFLSYDLEVENQLVDKTLVIFAFITEELEVLYPKQARKPESREYKVAQHNAKLYEKARNQVVDGTVAVPQDEVYAADVVTYRNIRTYNALSSVQN